MYNIIIWGTGLCYARCFNSLKLQEAMGRVKVLAVTSNDKEIRTSLDGYPFLAKKDIVTLDFDYCLVAIDNFSVVFKEAEHIGINKSKLVPMNVLLVPYFDFEKYITLKESKLSIFSVNCWGGICYHRLGLEFLSPTINCYFHPRDFNRFMRDLDYYLSLPVEFVKMNYNPDAKADYPSGMIGDIQIHFLHYTDFDYAKGCWEKRTERINKENILVVSCAEEIDIAVEFDELPYENKIIFTPFESNLKAGFYVYPDSNRKFGEVINAIARGDKNIFNMLAFLNHEHNFIRTF